MKVLVTGAAGYVGYAVAGRLAEAGHAVDGLVRRGHDVPAGVRPVPGDLLDRGTLRGSYDGICHLAALTRVRESFAHPLRFFAANVQGTVNLLESVQAGRVVFGSTAAVYGAPADQPITEECPAAPGSPYGASKLAAEQAVLFHAGTGAAGAVVLRTFNVAGSVDGRGDPDPTRIIPRALAVAAGRAPCLELNGDGAAVREFVHVADLADAYALALAAVRPGERRIYNAGSGTGVTMREVVATVERVTGRPVPTVTRPPQPEPPVLLSDSTALRRDLSWRPARSDLDRLVTDSWNALTSR